MSARESWTQRQAQHEQTMPREAPALASPMNAAHRCDRCGAQAYVRVLLPSRLELLFCAHHNRQYASALANIAVEIQDETMRLAFCALSGIRVIPIPWCRIAPSEASARQSAAIPRRLATDWPAGPAQCAGGPG